MSTSSGFKFRCGEDEAQETAAVVSAETFPRQNSPPVSEVSPRSGANILALGAIASQQLKRIHFNWRFVIKNMGTAKLPWRTHET